jgi:Flp pilus assembly protein CpaB
VQKLLSTRGGTIAVGGIAAILAGVLLLFYVSQYRDSVKQEQKPIAVLIVGNNLIPKGTSGDLIGSQQMYTISNIPADRVKNGAITDPNSLKGLIATDDLYPGKQLNQSDFVDRATNKVLNNITEYDRAVSVPLDSAHGLIGYVQAGDHVDILAGFLIDGADGKQHPILRTIMQNIPVLDAPSSSSKSAVSTNQTQNVVLAMTDDQAANLAFSSDNGKVWVMLRPPSGSLQHTPALVTLETLLFGVKPIAIERAYKNLGGN